MDAQQTGRHSIAIERDGCTVATFELTFVGGAPRLVLADCDPSLDARARRDVEHEALMAALFAYRDLFAYASHAPDLGFPNGPATG
jgi:hypothetical protein